MFLQLGDYIFDGIKLPAAWSGTFETQYSQIPIIGGKPVVQMTGLKLTEFEILAEFRDEFCTPADEVSALQLYRINGNVLQLTGGDGTNYGKFIITKIGIVNERAYPGGIISAIQASISLLEYNATAVTASSSAAALASSNPVTQDPVTPMVPLSGEISSNISCGIVASREVITRSSSTGINYARISSLAASAVQAFDTANAQVGKTKSIIYRAIALQGSLTAASNAAKAVKTAGSARSFTSLMSANVSLEQAVYFLKGAAAPVAAFIGTKQGGS